MVLFACLCFHHVQRQKIINIYIYISKYCHTQKHVPATRKHTHPLSHKHETDPQPRPSNLHLYRHHNLRETKIINIYIYLSKYCHTQKHVPATRKHTHAHTHSVTNMRQTHIPALQIYIYTDTPLTYTLTYITHI